MDRTEKQEKYTRIAEGLADLYGQPRWREHYPPVEELVLTILSQNTSDTNSIGAFKTLQETGLTWQQIKDMPVDELADIIRSAGLANSKAKYIQLALGHIEAENDGKISLDFLKDMEVEEAKAWLTGIKGIGPKTAAIVLLFSLKMPAFPVDTHVHRVSKRLGLIEPKTSREKAHIDLEAIAPPEDYYPFHLQMIQHGREICGARNPKCGICPLQDDCDFFNGLSADEREEKLAAADA